MLAAQGFFEWLLLDFEHTPVDRSSAAQILSTIADVSGGRVTPLARVSTGSVDQIKHALDAGAQGVIVPMIKDADEVRAAVRYARFPPEGERGAGGLTPHLSFGVSRPVYIQAVNREILFGVQIETLEAVENVEKILDVNGIDLCFVGPNDLHLALGYPAMFWSAEEKFAKAVGRVREACRQRGIPLGTLCRDVASAKARMEDGFQFIGLGSDAHFILQFAGMQHGDLHGLSEPPETWCNALKSYHGPYRGPAVRVEAAPATGTACNGAPPAATPSPRSNEFRFDPNAPEFDIDPSPVYRYMRENVPVHWWPEARGWVVTRYDDVSTLLRDRRFSVEVKDWENGPPELPDEKLTTHQALAKYGLFWMHSADHRRVRRVLGPLFTPMAVGCTKQIFQGVVDDVLQLVVGRDGMDLVADFTAKYPLLAITRLLGIPRRLQDDFIQFGSAVIDAFYPAISPEALREKLDFLPRGVSMLERIMEERRASPSSDFFSRIIHAEDQGERLTPKEVISMVALMISAGCEPPRHLISFAMYNLLRHPDQLQLLRSEPDLLRNAIDEAGRFDSFGKLNLPRFALEDVEIRGVKIAKGQQVFGVFASALRDPDTFPEPDKFDIRRDQSRSLLYGDGLHVCLGTWLAKNMAEAAVGTLTRRFPQMKLAGEPKYTRNAFFRKMVSLPVRLF
jgi:cytochrome P450/2-keto-3-deoxy-L-rhamnonate aldolase RhmA